MKPRVYLVLFLLIIPVQAGLFGPLAVGGIKPDLALVAVFIAGLLGGPIEAALAGAGLGLLQDVSSASLFGLTGLTRGLIGLAAGLLGSRVLDRKNPAIVLVLMTFSLAEGILIALFLQVTSGDVPFFGLLWRSWLPQAFYTGLLGLLALRLINEKRYLAALSRRALGKES